jgi:hypothetical protein
MNPVDRAQTSQDPILEREFQERCRLLQKEILHNPIPDWDLSRRRMYVAITRLGGQSELATALEHIEYVNDNPGHDAMFFRHANIDAWLRFGKLYPEGLQLKVKQSMLNEAHYQLESGTENHKIMNAVTGYLVAQSWPDWADAAEVKGRCTHYLDRYLTRVCRFGQGEFDSTTYSVFYLNSLATLYDFAEDTSWKNRAGMMMDWYLANTAGDWLDGLFVGAHSREYHPTFTHNYAPAGTVAAWLYFGGKCPDLRTGEPHYSIINALSAYRAPDILVAIAQDRRKEFEHVETHDITLATEPTHDGHDTQLLTGKSKGFKGLGYMSRVGVRKYTYLTPGYALGSMADGKQGDMIWSGQMRRWSLDWRSEQPSSVFFFNHPFPDFGNSEEPYVSNWQGSSPYEQVVQYKGALITLYHIPSGEQYKYGPRRPFQSDRDPYIDGFFSKTAILKMVEDTCGWIFCHCGTVMMAIRVIQPYRWAVEDGIHRRLRSEGLRNAVIVQTAQPSDFRLELEGKDDAGDQIDKDLARFREAVLTTTTHDASAMEHSSPGVTFQTLTGDRLGIVYNGERTINGVPIDYNGWPLISNPFIHSDINSGILELRHEGKKLILDFNEGQAYHGI